MKFHTSLRTARRHAYPMRRFKERDPVMRTTPVPPILRFNVGPHVYVVKIDPKKPLKCIGLGNVAGLCCRAERIIWIDKDLPAEDRIETLFHELVHAWFEHFSPHTYDEEKVAIWVSSFTVDVWRQLEAQGGPDALNRLQPIARNSIGGAP